MTHNFLPLLRNTILTARISGSMTVQKKGNVNLSLIAMNRAAEADDTHSLTERTGTLGYSYRFRKK